MTVLLPLHLIERVRRTARRAAGRTTSPFNRSSQEQFWGGEWWEYTLDFAIHVQREGPQMAAFFAQVGTVGTFLLRDPAFQTSAAGAPVVSGTGQTGYTLTTSGWPVNTTVLRAGDAFQIGTGLDTRLHMLTQDALSGSTGGATLNFWPALRYSPLNGAPLVVSQPAVLLKLTEEVEFEISKVMIHRFTVNAVEAL